ncbi:Ntn hydrolase family protein [Candidatus Nanopusillus massiliensis]|uniref:hypothetical protein n=1 Tax=Candidatus Nanopusillus massiliensis TaxID=2897163 RepID=UPI0021133F71|nr:hypothetical protein [Candidatus Nanopusillus massiliensis]
MDNSDQGIEDGQYFHRTGKLILVEYAKQAAKAGSTAIGISTTDGILIIADKKIPSKLIITDSIEKIMEIDDNIIGTFSVLYQMEEY